MNKLVPILLAAALAVTITACRESTPGSSSETDMANATVISGTVIYRERMALSNQAELEITLEDVSRQDVAAKIIARQVIKDTGQVPIRFELPYEPADIDERMSYSLRAKLRDRGRLMFISDTHAPVLTRGGGREAHLMLVAVQTPAENPPAATAEPLSLIHI